MPSSVLLLLNKKLSPSFTFDGRSSTLPYGLTFSRASSATYIDDNGVLRTAASGVRRFTSQGTLIEESKTNLCYPSVPDASWLSSGNSLNVSLGSNATAIDGTNTAALLLDNATNSAHYLRNNNVTYVVSGTTYTLSIFAKASTQSAIQLFPYSGCFGSGAYANFNLAAGTIGNYAVATPVIQNCGNGWYRCSITMPATATGTCAALGLCLINSQLTAARLVSYAGTGTGVYVWGDQDEAGAFPTSYIPTTTAAATRAGEGLYTTSIPWFNAAAGTFMTEYVLGGGVGNTSRVQASLNDGSIKNRLQFYNQNAVDTVDARSGGTIVWEAYINGAVTADTVMKIGMSYAAADYKGTQNGAVPLSQASGALPVGINRLDIGQRNLGYQLNGWIRSFKYIPYAVSANQLQAMTL